MGDAAPWFFEVLGVPAYADAVMVRRAYAGRLRAIDPEADASGFERLRAAYEAARTWCEQHAADGEVDVAVPTPPADEADTVKADNVVDALAEQLSRDLSAQPASAVEALLDTALASLRRRYIDAPGQFEERIVDLLRACAIPHRPEVFAAASRQFRWHEVAGHDARDVRQAWVERVTAQHEAWRDFERRAKSRWMVLIERAQHGLDAGVARRWPDMAHLRDVLPDWLTLHLTPAELAAWKAAYDALPAGLRQAATTASPPTPSLPPAYIAWRRERRVARYVVIAFAALALLAGWLVGPFDRTAAPRLAPVGIDSPQPSECAALYERFNLPIPFKGMDAPAMERVKRRAQRCAMAGHWKPSSPGSGR
jgi:hypothetical protein